MISYVRIVSKRPLVSTLANVRAIRHSFSSAFLPRAPRRVSTTSFRPSSDTRILAGSVVFLPIPFQLTRTTIFGPLQSGNEASLNCNNSVGTASDKHHRGQHEGLDLQRARVTRWLR